MFSEGEIVILNERAKNGLPYRIGERCIITDMYYHSPNYNYLVEFDDCETSPVKECELNKLTETDEKYMDFIFTKSKVIYTPTYEEVAITKVDYVNRQASIMFEDKGVIVVTFESLKEFENERGR